MTASASHAIEALGIAPAGVLPAYQCAFTNRVAAHSQQPKYTTERHAAWLAGRTLS